MSKYPHLFQSLKLGDLVLKNRIFMAPMTRGRGGSECIANSTVAEYYAQRADAGLIITEGTHVSKMAVGWCNVPGIFKEEHATAWKEVTDAVHAKGGVIFAQLWHQGRQSHSSFLDGKTPVSSSTEKLQSEDGIHTYEGKQSYETPHALTIDEIKETVEDFRKAAQLAKDAGFDGVEIHGANGYLVDQFLQSKTNKRTDEYGGSIENQFRFLNEVADAVLSVWPSKRVGVRLSPNGVYGEMGTPEFRELFLYTATELGKKNIGYLHVMDGLGFGFHKLGEPMTLSEFRAVIPADVVLVGNVAYTAESANETIGKGDADAIAFGRPFISNPDLVERFKNDWPLNDPAEPTTWYGAVPDKPLGTAFTDYPFYEESAKDAEAATTAAQN